MKKILSVLLAMLMIISCAACGKEDAQLNELTGLYDEGYICDMYSATEEVWKGMFHKEDNFETIYVASAPFTSDLYEEFNKIAWEYDGDDADKLLKDFYCTLENISVEKITDIIPTEEELAAYTGLKFKDLEDQGFESTGWSGMDGEYTFSFDGPRFYAQVIAEEEIKDIDDLSPNDMRELTIKSMSFSGVSSGILDIE